MVASENGVEAFASRGPPADRQDDFQIRIAPFQSIHAQVERLQAERESERKGHTHCVVITMPSRSVQ